MDRFLAPLSPICGPQKRLRPQISRGFARKWLVLEIARVVGSRGENSVGAPILRHIACIVHAGA